jgi:hypothetical protein
MCLCVYVRPMNYSSSENLFYSPKTFLGSHKSDFVVFLSFRALSLVHCDMHNTTLTARLTTKHAFDSFQDSHLPRLPLLDSEPHIPFYQINMGM